MLPGGFAATAPRSSVSPAGLSERNQGQRYRGRHGESQAPGKRRRESVKHPPATSSPMKPPAYPARRSNVLSFDLRSILELYSKGRWPF